MRSHPKALLAVMGVLLLAACGGGDSTTGVQGDFTGTFSLSTINGTGLPFTIPFSQNTVTFTGGSFTIAADGTFSDVLLYQTSSAGNIDLTSTCPGTYIQSGNSFTFTEPSNPNDSVCGGIFAGSGSGNTLTINFAVGFQAAYSK